MPNKKEFNKNGVFVNGDDNINFKKFIGKIVGRRYLFIGSIIVFAALAFLYTHYATPAYKVNSKITVEDDQSNSLESKTTSSSMLDFSDLLDMSSNVYNELDILTSNNLMTEVTKDMHLNVVIYQKARITKEELYDTSPFDVTVIEKADSLQERNYNIELKNGIIHLTNSKDDVDLKVKFDQVVHLEQYDLIFKPNHGKPIDELGYILNIKSVDDKVDELSKAFDVQLTDKKSTTLALTLEYPNSKKGEAIVTKLMDLYLKSNLQNKKEMADSTLNFIDTRLKIVNSQLSGVENNFSEFKKQNQLADIDEQGKALVGNVTDYYNKLNDQEAQLLLLNDVEKYINNPANKRLIPNTFSVQDPVFVAAIGKYDDVLLQRDQMAMSYKDKNPFMKNIDDDLEAARVSLVKSFYAYKKFVESAIKDLKSKNNVLTEQVKSVPEKEKVFLDYSRRQDFTQQLYLYLLQKREETAISQTSTLSTARIISNAKADYLPFQPKKGMIYLLGLVLGFLVPYGYITAIDILNIKILNKEDIQSNTSVPILGEIGHNTLEESVILFDNSRSVVSEQFRALRTNLQFVLNPKGTNVILITSSMSGEGKSFISTNLGTVLSLTGKRVLLMELDLRKPKLSEALNLDSSFGFTNYMVSYELKLEDIIQPLAFSKNCFAISSGPVPPNPSEILNSERFAEMIVELKTKFDYIIIDSSPIGLVSDAQLIEKYCDVNLYIVRQEYTFKSQLNIINELVDDGKFKRAYLVINDIKTKKGGYYGYGYGYGHGYGYGYGYGENGHTKRGKKLVKYVKEEVKG